MGKDPSGIPWSIWPSQGIKRNIHFKYNYHATVWPTHAILQKRKCELTYVGLNRLMQVSQETAVQCRTCQPFIHLGCTIQTIHQEIFTFSDQSKLSQGGN